MGRNHRFPRPSSGSGALQPRVHPHTAGRIRREEVVEKIGKCIEDPESRY